jgi:hypothetical protein
MAAHKQTDKKVKQLAAQSAMQAMMQVETAAMQSDMGHKAAVQTVLQCCFAAELVLLQNLR